MTIEWTLARRPMRIALAAVVASAALADAAGARGNGRPRDEVREIIVHATGGPSCEGGRVVFSPAGTVARMKLFFESSGFVSIHYIVGPDGEVAASVPEDEVAIHTIGHNQDAIGIELINAGDGQEPYPKAQIAALVKLITDIRGRWRIPLAAVRGHDEVDRSTFWCAGREVRRKQDPGPLFPWADVRTGVRKARAR